jgi:hypothetical protein
VGEAEDMCGAICTLIHASRETIKIVADALVVLIISIGVVWKVVKVTVLQGTMARGS